ncbi:MAG TPA: hypothetical protein VFG83_09725 [Kofleriaceae bacterium]|nr:hypothetical protein [Kofleriaceae bacterium]
MAGQDGRCALCGACLHEVILNGTCLACGKSDITTTIKPATDVVAAERLRRRKR